MQITLPQKPDNQSPVTIETRLLVVIGANGAGKSSFGKDILKRYPEQAEHISGMHALFLEPEEWIRPEETGLAYLQRFITERNGTLRLTAFEKLLFRLQKEEFEKSVLYKERLKTETGLPLPVTKIDIIQQVWEKMFPQSKLIRKSGLFELLSTGRENSPTYRPGRMSDGEKIVFYLIGAILCARKNALLIIEQPEILLHDSIKNTLWNELERLRPDCSFIYLTHDMGFINARQEGECIWIRSFNSDDKVWDYELIENKEQIPEEVYIDLLGSRKPVLFIEGTASNSIDYRLYPLIFPDFLVKPMGGCQKVIETTKAVRQLKDFHTLESKGIVDRDRRTEEEIGRLREQEIYVPDVAEVENLLLLEPVIKTVAERLMKDPDTIFSQVKENIIRLFEKDMESQLLLHTRHRIRKKLEMAVNYKFHSVDEMAGHVEELGSSLHIYDIYRQLKESFTELITGADYNGILRMYNQKGTLPQSKLCQLLGINNKESYLNMVLSLLKENKEEAAVIRKAIRNALGTNNT